MRNNNMTISNNLPTQHTTSAQELTNLFKYLENQGPEVYVNPETIAKTESICQRAILENDTITKKECEKILTRCSDSLQNKTVVPISP